MALRPQVVHLVGLHFLHNARQIGRVRKIPTMQNKPLLFYMWVLLDMVYALGIKQ